jgi:hypothetical protein
LDYQNTIDNEYADQWPIHHLLKINQLLRITEQDYTLRPPEESSEKRLTANGTIILDHNAEEKSASTPVRQTVFFC